jgi:hypothetical protein
MSLSDKNFTKCSNYMEVYESGEEKFQQEKGIHGGTMLAYALRPSVMPWLHVSMAALSEYKCAA